MKTKSLTRNLLTWLLHLLYPERCPFCDKVLFRALWDDRSPACNACVEDAELVKEPACKKCGKGISDQRQEYCPDCMRLPHLFEQGKALWAYKGKVKESIYRFKYSGRAEYGAYYAQAIAKRHSSWVRSKGVQAIVPIPLHPSRKRQRGYNQAELIAKELGKQLQLPVKSKLLFRLVNTKPQKELNDKERRNNLKKAFKVRKNAVELKKVLLVDDIYTTGSTLDGATAALKEAGIGQVFFISVSIGRGF